MADNGGDFVFYVQFIDVEYNVHRDMRYAVLYTIKIMEYEVMDCPFNCNGSLQG